MKNFPIKIGITGGMGSGKTTLSNILKNMGFPVYNTDKAAAEIMKSEEKIISKIKKIFGEDIYDESGILDKKKLASLIFKDVEKLEAVNRLIHPEVMRDFKKWYESRTEDMVFCESAILFESGWENEFDYILCVTADIDKRIERIRKRDGISREAVMERLKNQMPEKEKCMRSDFILCNNEVSSLEQEVRKLVSQIRSKVKYPNENARFRY